MTNRHFQRDEFEQLATLAEDDPEAFETLRAALIERFIEEAPEERRPRLRCLQWRIDQERARAKTPLGACIRLTRMMWDRVLSPGGLVDHLQRLSEPRRPSGANPRRGATILPFPHRSG